MSQLKIDTRKTNYSLFIDTILTTLRCKTLFYQDTGLSRRTWDSIREHGKFPKKLDEISAYLNIDQSFLQGDDLLFLYDYTDYPSIKKLELDYQKNQTSLLIDAITQLCSYFINNKSKLHSKTSFKNIVKYSSPEVEQNFQDIPYSKEIIEIIRYAVTRKYGKEMECFSKKMARLVSELNQVHARQYLNLSPTELELLSNIFSTHHQWALAAKILSN